VKAVALSKGGAEAGPGALAGAGAVALGGAFVLLKCYSNAPTLSDDFIYYYMAQRVAEGAIPYRDFFFAHPPLHLLPATILTALLGFSIPLARAIPAASALLAGAAVYRIGRRAGLTEGLVALTLFLFSYDLLRTSSHYTGAAEATALLAWSLERALAGRPDLSGLLGAAAGLTAFFALPAVAATGLFLLLGGAADRRWRRFAAAFLSLFLGVNALCAAAFGSAYWDPVIRYHLLKPSAGDAQIASEALVVAADNAWLFFGAPAAATLGLLLGRAREGRWAVAALGLLAAFFHLTFLSLSTRVFVYYYIPAFPGLAVAGGVALAEAARAIGQTTRRWSIARGEGRLAGGHGPPSRVSRAATLAACALVVVGPLFVRPLVGEAAGLFAPERRSGPQRYVWRDAPIPASMNAALRALFWRDTPPSPWSPAVTRYLQHESLHYEAPARLAGRIRELTPPHASLFGDSLTAPLVALLSGRTIALDEADTNYMRWTSGITSPAGALERLEGAPPAAVITAPFSGFHAIPQFRDWLQARYRLAETHIDPLYGPRLLYLRAGGGESGSGVDQGGEGGGTAGKAKK